MDLPINKTLATEVILFGFSKNFRINIALFCLFFIIYLVSIFGNVFMVYAIIANPHLHSPMYFFLCILSLIDIFYSSRTIPKLLVNLLSGGRISLIACGLQVYAGSFLGGTECLLLALMAYDRYVAICRPLNYPTMMRWNNCYRLTALIWLLGFMTTVLPSLLVPVRVCNPNQINHFVCELPAVIKLSCDSIHTSEVMILCMSVIILLFPFIFILLSYTVIISSVLKLHSTGRSKAFSTCSSHITVVALQYGTAIFMHFVPPSKETTDQEKYACVFNTILIPMVNPVIYSLKNKEVTKMFAVKSERCPGLDSPGKN